MAGVVGLTWGTASAHNSLVSSDPSNGATLSTAPTQVVWVFANPVPLETLTVTLTDATGVRTELPGSTHGASGETEVVTPLPALQPGPVSVRWRLVGTDGHAITGSIDFTVAPPATTTTVISEVTSTVPASAAPTSTSIEPPPSTVAAVSEPSSGASDGWYSTPSGLRWLLRYGSYVAIIAAVGLLLITAFVWPDTVNHPVARRVLGRSLITTAVLGTVQLMVLASDVGGKAPWSAFDSLGAATTTDAGMAFAVRVAVALTLWVVIFHSHVAHADIFWTGVSLSGLGLLATWAFAGHSRSKRWPAVGVTADVAHHAAAAAWIAGLAVVGWIIIPKAAPAALGPAMRRFGTLAARSVAVLAVTGVVQAMRLVGNPFALFDTDHGSYLAAKLVALLVMLGLANANRRRVSEHLNDTQGSRQQVKALRTAVLVEFAIGLVIVAITAAMVVSPPAAG